MHPLTKGALGVAVLGLLGGPPPELRMARHRMANGRGSSVVPAGSVDTTDESPEAGRCPPRTLAVQTAPDETTCVALPGAESLPDARMRRLAELPPGPDYLKLTAPSEMVQRLPERSERWADYQLPVAPVIAVDTDLDAVEDERPRLGIRVITDAQTPVTLVDLEGQDERPEVVLVGELYGVTVVVRHRIPAPEGEREYLVFYGNLDRPGPSIVSGARLSPLSVIGFIGEDDLDEPHLYLEVRQEQPDLGTAEHLTKLVTQSIAVDARNVLPLAR